MCSGAANACKHRAALVVVFSTVVLPCVLHANESAQEILHDAVRAKAKRTVEIPRRRILVQ
jgi:hypothetical protein